METGDIDLVFLGSGNAFAYGRDWSNFVLDNRVMFEAGPTALPRLRELGMSPADIEVIFISHLHADHVFGLPFLMLDHYYLSERDGPLFVVGPVGIEEMCAKLMELGYPGMSQERKGRLTMEFLEVEPDGEYEVCKIPFSTLEMSHGKTLDIGYEMEYNGKTISYSGDTGACDNLDSLVTDADLAIVEMSSPGERIPGHMSVEDVLRLRGLMRPEARLIVTHLPNMDWGLKDRLLKCGEGLIDIAEDLQRFHFTL